MSIPPARIRYLRIGQLADAAGVSAKALRLYERHGLLRPQAHSQAGYRLYGPEAIVRLRQILLLKQAGVRLSEMSGLLARDARIAEHWLRHRLAALHLEVVNKSAMVASLQRLLARIDSASTLEQLLESVTMTIELEVDLTAEQRAAMQARLRALGEAGVHLAQQEWPALIARATAAMQAGMAADSEEARACALRWKALVDMATGGDGAVAHRIGDAWKANPAAMAQMGMSPELMRWVGQAMQVAGVRFD